MQEARWEIQFKRSDADDEPYNWMRWHSQYDGWFYANEPDPRNEAVENDKVRLEQEYPQFDFRIIRELRNFTRTIYG